MWEMSAWQIPVVDRCEVSDRPSPKLVIKLYPAENVQAVLWNKDTP